MDGIGEGADGPIRRSVVEDIAWKGRWDLCEDFAWTDLGRVLAALCEDFVWTELGRVLAVPCEDLVWTDLGRVSAALCEYVVWTDLERVLAARCDDLLWTALHGRSGRAFVKILCGRSNYGGLWRSFVKI